MLNNRLVSASLIFSTAELLGMSVVRRGTLDHDQKGSLCKTSSSPQPCRRRYERRHINCEFISVSAHRNTFNLGFIAWSESSVGQIINSSLRCNSGNFDVR